MSASSTPTVNPSAATAAARLTVTDDLPTPPLPLAMARIRVDAGTSVLGAFSRAFQRALSITSRALLAGHLAPVDLDLGHTGVHGDPGLDVFLDLGPQRAAADRQLHTDRDHAVFGDGDRREPCRA